MKIEISKSEVYKEVEKLSSVAGASVSGGDNFGQFWASEYEWQLLEAYWLEGRTSVEQIFMRYIRNQTVGFDLTTYDEDEAFTILAEMPDGFDDFLTGSIANAVKMLLVFNVLAGWFSTKSAELSDIYQKNAQGYAEDIKKKLLYRMEPPQNRANDAITSDNITFTQYEKCYCDASQKGDHE